MRRRILDRLGKLGLRCLGAVSLLLLLVGLPACQGSRWNRRDPYTAARPSYEQPVMNPMRLGGYAGYNYGLGRPRRVEPVIPIEEPVEVDQ